MPLMHIIMKIPLRAAIATSNYLIGATAVTGSLIYYRNDYLDPSIIAPSVLGVFFGALLGARLSQKVKATFLRILFVLVLTFLSIQMILKGFGIDIFSIGDLLKQ